MGRVPLWPDPSNLFTEWFELVETGAISGKRAHDARIVAWMRAHSLSSILTFNPADFKGFDGIQVLAGRQSADQG